MNSEIYFYSSPFTDKPEPVPKAIASGTSGGFEGDRQILVNLRITSYLR